jgi:hypothetical protein
VGIKKKFVTAIDSLPQATGIASTLTTFYATYFIKQSLLNEYGVIRRKVSSYKAIKL